MDSRELRKKFIQFFVERDHKQVSSASLIPEDQSVLFTTAGMQQFKKFYTSPEVAPAKNVVTVQPCFRTSDIEEVGDDTHLTFFEMLGNFSFGGYSKKETIEMGYEFLTKELEIDPKRIHCSVFKGDDINSRDEESAKILENMGLVYEEHSREDNFWGPTGEEGPCGPTVEFYVDNIEIWNLVFNEYYKEKSGKYRNLETKGVDTGMGLERMLVVVNKVENVFHTDLFDLPHEKLHQFLKKEDPVDERIILDHIKAAVFAINDGILPSNKERGYIVRRLIRRAIVKGNQIGIAENFIEEIAQEVFQTYEGTYQFDQKMIQDELEKEETKFRDTLRQGLSQFKRIVGGFGSAAFGREQPKNVESNVLTGRELFDLYQTYGFPIELSLEVAKEKKVQIEENAIEDFNKKLRQHQELSRTTSAGMFRGGLADGGEMETKYHTATHLLLSSLRQVLGPDVYQKGSNITAERLRLDFNFPEKLTDEQIKKVEDLVNVQIKKDLPVQMQEMTLEEAKKSGAMGVFENKYGNKVKVYSIGDFSQEICGGPHAKSTGVLGHFKITKEESSSSGIRRIKAILE